MLRRALALPLAVLASAFVVPTPAGAAPVPGITDVTFSPRPFVVNSTGEYPLNGRFVVTLPAADSAVENLSFRLVPASGASGPVPLSLSGRGCAAYFTCVRDGQVLSVTVAANLFDKPLKTVYRNPGAYRPVATVGILDGPVLTATGARVVKVRRETGCSVEAAPKAARIGAPLTIYGRQSGLRDTEHRTVTLWFDPAGKAAPVKVRTVKIPRNQIFYQLVVPHRGTGTWQSRYRGDTHYAPCVSEPAKVRTLN